MVERICLRSIKIFIDLIAGAQSENFLRILRREIPQCIILRREEWKRCERDVNHMRKINASYITRASALLRMSHEDQFSHRDELSSRPAGSSASRKMCSLLTQAANGYRARKDGRLSRQ